MTETYDQSMCTIVIQKRNVILTKSIYNAFRNWIRNRYNIKRNGVYLVTDRIRFGLMFNEINYL